MSLCLFTEVGKDLSAARRKDLDEGEYNNVMHQRNKRDPPQPVNRSQSAKNLMVSSKFSLTFVNNLVWF